MPKVKPTKRRNAKEPKAPYPGDIAQYWAENYGIDFPRLPVIVTKQPLRDGGGDQYWPIEWCELDFPQKAPERPERVADLIKVRVGDGQASHLDLSSLLLV